MYFNKDGKIISFYTKKENLEKHGLLQQVLDSTSFLDDSYSITERLICIKNNITSPPVCKTCGKKTKRNTEKNASGFRPYCSQKCVQKDFTNRDEIAAAKKRKTTMFEKYGVEYNSQRPEIKTILNHKKKSRINTDAFNKLNNKEWLEHNYVTQKRTAIDIASELKCDYSTVLNYVRQYGFKVRKNYNSSKYEKEICDFLDSYDIEYECSNSSIISPLELDIYIPAFNFAIEFNGIYWHSNDDKQRHLNKTEQCEKLGIQLFHIFENEWLDQKDIWKSMILNKVGKSQKIFARKTTLVKVDSKEARTFYNNNHLQGFVGGDHYGLLYNNELVQLITVGKNRFKEGYELLRNCTRQNNIVVGGFSKLISNLESEYFPLTSYCNRRYSSGNSYKKVGFTLKGTTAPSYFWVDAKNMKIYNRMSTQKHKLPKLLPSFDDSLSESQNMFMNKYRRIWDCGNYVFEYTKL